MKRSVRSHNQGASNVQQFIFFVIGCAVIIRAFTLFNNKTNSEHYDPGIKLYREGDYAAVYADFEQDRRLFHQTQHRTSTTWACAK